MPTFPDRDGKPLATVVHSPGNREYPAGFLALFKRAHKTETTYQVWEEGNHPQIVESNEVMRQKLDYIYQNPAEPKNQMGGCVETAHASTSSARTVSTHSNCDF